MVHILGTVVPRVPYSAAQAAGRAPESSRYVGRWLPVDSVDLINSGDPKLPPVHNNRCIGSSLILQCRLETVPNDLWADASPQPSHGVHALLRQQLLLPQEASYSPRWTLQALSRSLKSKPLSRWGLLCRLFASPS